MLSDRFTTETRHRSTAIPVSGPHPPWAWVHVTRATEGPSLAA